VVVDRFAVGVDEVVAVHVVDVTVAVIVPAVAGNLAGVGPDVGRQVGVGVVHAGVDDGDNGGGGAGEDVPGGRGADVGAGGAAGLAGVLPGPLRRELRVVGHAVDVQSEIRLRLGDERAGLEGRPGPRHRPP